MCGIAGIWNVNNTVNREHLVQFTNSMTHRGPDGAGYELLDQGYLGLGHRRLSILDLSENGKQPMQFGKFTITYNGEIFNFAELKTELESLGYSFNTKTDTEVALAAYDQWGVEAFHKFNGMWAMAIFDTEKHELLLCCDRYGIKPIYYSEYENGGLAFASETYAFNYLQDYKKSIDWDLVELQMKDDYVLEPLGYTVFNRIYRLLPGHTIRLKRGEKPVQKRWYDIRTRLNKTELSFEEACSKFQDLFADSCKLRLRSDVPLATALSGGIDSSVVLGTIVSLSKEEGLERTPENLHQSFTMTFPGWENDERHFAQSVLDFHQLSGNMIELDESNLGEMVEEGTVKTDFIMSNPLLSVTQVYAAMKAKGISVSMDGHGVDELLFGYKNMLWELHGLLLKSGEKEEAKKVSSYILSTYPESQKQGIRDYITKLEKDKSILGRVKQGAKALLKPESKKSLPPSLSDTHYDWSDYKNDPKEIPLNYFFTKSMVPILRNFDKAAMLASVEVRMPFMDYRLVEFCLSLPLEYAVNQEFNKLILREVSKGLIPENIRTRKLKLGFLSPIEKWMDGSLAEWAEKIKSTEAYKNIPEKIKNEATTSKEVWKLLNIALISNNESKF
jgi:asparagine synthase (glutamine-hydrolysing)